MRAVARLLLGGLARKYEYDVGYMEDYASASPGGFFRYLFASPFALYRRKAPKYLYYAAKLASTQRSDCGPCLRLVYNMARDADVDAVLLRAVLQRDFSRVADRDQATELEGIVRYVHAVLDHDLLLVGELGEQLIERWGQATLNELAGAIAFGQFFPTFKRGMLRAQSCEPVVAELIARETGSREAASQSAMS